MPQRNRESKSVKTTNVLVPVLLLVSLSICGCYSTHVIRDGPHSDVVAKAQDKLFVQTNDSTVFTLTPQAYVYTSAPRYQLFGFPITEAGWTDRLISIRGEDIASTSTIEEGSDSNKTTFVLASGKKLSFRPDMFVLMKPADSSGLWGIGIVRQGKMERPFSGRVSIDEKTMFWFREYNQVQTNMLLGGIGLVVMIKMLSDLDCIFCFRL
jgi:hypothetical protein